MQLNNENTVYSPVSWQGTKDNNSGLIYGIETREYEDYDSKGHCEVLDVSWYADESIRDNELLKLKGDWGCNDLCSTSLCF